MSAAKEALHHVIELLSDEQTRQTLTFIQRLRQPEGDAHTLKRLARDPTFRVPSADLGGFRKVEALSGTGIPASQRLREDRR